MGWVRGDTLLHIFLHVPSGRNVIRDVTSCCFTRAFLLEPVHLRDLKQYCVYLAFDASIEMNVLFKCLISQMSLMHNLD